jgi:tetratricopeptide (TPR) repeat protein
MGSPVHALLVLLAAAIPAALAPLPAAPAKLSPPPAAPGPVGPAYPNAEALSRYADGRLQAERGEEDDALAEFYRVLSLDPRSRSASRAVSEIAARHGDAARSLEFAERALAEDPGDARSLWLKGSAQFNLGRGDESIATLESAALADSEQTQYWLTLARVAEHLDRIPIVARAFTHAVALDEDDAESWFQLAAADARLARYGAADSALDRAVALNPSRPGSVFLRAWIRERDGRPTEAIDLYHRHLEHHPDDQTTRARLVELLGHEKRYSEAWEEAKRIAKALPGDPDAAEAEADMAFRLKRTRDADAALERLRRIAPDDPGMTARSLEVLARNGRATAGVPLADAWAKAHPGDYRGDMLVAQALLADRQVEPALARAHHATATAPDSLAPRILLGRLLQNEKRYAEAAEVWEAAVAHFPTVIGPGLDLAFCREQQGDLDGAERAAKAALDRDGNNAAALNFLGYLYADHNRNLPEAESLVKRAVEQDPDNGAYLDSMGWVYFRLGRLEDARAPLERAAQLTGDAVVLEHLGDVYKSLKLLDLARDLYRRSLSRDSLNARVRAKLDGIR